MKKIYLVACCLLVLVFNSNNSRAQGTLSLDTTATLNTTLPMGGQMSISARLTNTSPTDTFNGFIDFALANGVGIINDVNVFGEPQISGTLFKLAPLEYKALLFTITPNGSYFSPGPDIIIVWPIAPSATIIDSARAPINILQSTGVNTPGTEQTGIFVADNTLFVYTGNDKINLERVQIFSLLGQPLQQYICNSSSFRVPLSNLPEGIYLAEAITGNGQRKVLKFVK